MPETIAACLLDPHWDAPRLRRVLCYAVEHNMDHLAAAIQAQIDRMETERVQ